MVREKVIKEMRQGVVFTAHISNKQLGWILFILFIEGQKKPVFVVKITSGGCDRDGESLMDIVFQNWVTNGKFRETVKDPAILSMLLTCEQERLEGILWYRKTFRFLPAEGSTRQNPKFILTMDKSDLPDHYKRILEVGEQVVQREEAEREEARKLRAKEKQEREENLRTENAQLIVAVAKAAINGKAVSADSIRKLSELGLLKRSTTFRGGALFPGESFILWYDFTGEKTRFAGWIGFDSDLNLISVDEHLPKENQVYLR
jgi:hypothetical protein